MAYYVYIIQSLSDGSFYKGFSENPIQRLQQHNNKLSHYTSAKVPWKLIYIELCESKTLALKRETALKKYSRSQIGQLIVSHKNILNSFYIGENLMLFTHFIKHRFQTLNMPAIKFVYIPAMQKK